MAKLWTSVSRKKFGIFLVLCLAMILNDMIYSIPAPILPTEVLARDATVTQYSIVLAIFDLATLLVSPAIGLWVPKAKIELATSLNTGVALCGISTILFGILGYTTATGSLFIGIACGLRIFQALGNCIAFVITNYVIVELFQDQLGVAIGVLESVMGFAIAIGPFLGSSLYEIGGFPVPFEVVGGLTVLLVPVIFFNLRNWRNLVTNDLTHAPLEDRLNTSTFAILRILPIPVYFWIVVVGCTNYSFLTTLMAIELLKFELSQTYVGLVFLISATLYGIFSPGFSYLCDKMRAPEVVPIGGFVLQMAGFLLIGPLSFLPLSQTLELFLSSVCLISIGYATTMSPAYLLALKEALKSYSSDTAKSSMEISGFYYSGLGTGFFLGPLLAGFLYDAGGFQKATLVPFGLTIIQVLLLTVFTIWKHTCYKPKRVAEARRLLEDGIRKTDY